MSQRLRIITPCSASWSSMVGDDRTRYCQHCNLHVHNLSKMTQSEVEQLLLEHEGRICGRMHQANEESAVIADSVRYFTTKEKGLSRILASALTAAMSVSVAFAQTSSREQVPHLAIEATRSNVTITISDSTGAV
ncbi:MAG TPA: hypothetical protein VG498_22945, partial [Terriglobales bacterium]|nr:hypothetical protein [Terriglobales bacterium]